MSLYGIPQKRRRFTLCWLPVFQKSPCRNRRVKQGPSETFSARRTGFRESKPAVKDETKFLHASAGLSAKNLERLRMTKERRRRQIVTGRTKRRIRLPCYASDEKKFPDTYGRMWWDRPAPTITTKFFSVTNGRFAHPGEDRGLSLREGATLQTFPKDYEFIGTGMGPIAKMIGNAFPPDFAKLIGERISVVSRKHA